MNIDDGYEAIRKQEIITELKSGFFNAHRFTEKSDLIIMLQSLNDKNMPSIKSIRGSYSTDDFKNAGIENVVDYIQPIKFKIAKNLNTITDKIKSANKFTSKNNVREYLNGVFIDGENKRIVASDSHVLCVYKDTTLPDDTYILNVNKNEKIECKYPNFFNVFSNEKECNVYKITRIQEILDLINGLSKLKKITGQFDIDNSISLDDDNRFSYRINYLKLILGESARNFKDEIKILINKNNGIIFIRNIGSDYVLMPTANYYRGYYVSAIGNIELYDYI